MNFHEGSASHKLAVTKLIIMIKSPQISAVGNKRADWHDEILAAMLLICTEALSRQHAPQAMSIATPLHTHTPEVSPQPIYYIVLLKFTHTLSSAREIMH